jgi:hypothetical protein
VKRNCVVRGFVESFLGLAFASTAWAQITPGACLVSSTCLNAASCELTAPTHSNGDVLVAFAVANDSTFTQTLRINEAGWTTRAHRNATGGADRSLLVSTKVASSESGTYTLDTVEGAAATVEWKGEICAFAGVHADVLDAATVYASDVTDNDQIDPAAITTATANALVITALAAGNSGGSDLTGPSGHTELFDEIGAATIWIAGSYLNVASPGSSNPGVWSGMTATADSSVATLALKAATDAEWTVSPTVTSTTSSSYTLTFTTNINATVYGVACNPGVPNPTGAEVIAGNCDTGVPAQATCTESVTGGVSDTCVLSGIVWPKHDLHLIACPEAGIC